MGEATRLVDKFCKKVVPYCNVSAITGSSIVSAASLKVLRKVFGEPLAIYGEDEYGNDKLLTYQEALNQLPMCSRIWDDPESITEEDIEFSQNVVDAVFDTKRCKI